LTTISSAWEIKSSCRNSYLSEAQTNRGRFLRLNTSSKLLIEPSAGSVRHVSPETITQCRAKAAP